MQNRSLEDDKGRGDVVLDLDLDRVREVLWDGGHREEVGGADEEVAVEGGHAQVLGRADAHDRLEHDRHREDFAELVRELDRVFCAGGVERGVEVRLARGVVRQAG